MLRLRFIGAASVLSALTLALVLGCSDDEASGPSIDALPEEFASAACEAVSDCLGPAYAIIFPGEDCEGNVEKGVADLVTAIDDSLHDGRIAFHGKKLGACLDAVRVAGCAYPDALDGDVCRAALDGKVAAGADCDFSVECEGSAFCKSDGACPGKCTATEPDGGKCTHDTDCARGLGCDTVKGQCFLPAGSGDRCEGGVAPECEAGLFCLGASEGDLKAGTCRPFTEVLSAAEGAPCSPVEGPMCGLGLHCRIDTVAPALTATCVAGVAKGAPCGAAFPDMCPPEQYCAVPTDQLVGTCADRPAAGTACAAGPFGEPADICAPNSRCDGGKCRVRQEVGGTCVANDVCLSEHCVNGTCALAGACE